MTVEDSNTGEPNIGALKSVIEELEKLEDELDEQEVILKSDIRRPATIRDRLLEFDQQLLTAIEQIGALAEIKSTLEGSQFTEAERDSMREIQNYVDQRSEKTEDK